MVEKTTKERLTALEVGQEGLKCSIHLIETNHLPHLQTGLDKNGDKLDALKMWILGGLLTTILTLTAVVFSLLTR